MAKFLIFSDLHLHSFQYGHRIIDGVNSRLLEIASVLETIIEWGHKLNCDAILFGGDFYHIRNVSREELYLSGHILSQCKIPIYAISGNHDIRKDCLYSSIEPMRGLLTLLEDQEVEIKGVKVRGIPYTKKKLKIEGNKPDILICHTGVRGAEMMTDFVDYTSEESVETLAGLAQYVICGHYHNKQLFKYGDSTVLIPGAPCQHNFSDEGQDRGCWIWNNGDLHFEPIAGPLFATMTKEESLEPSEINYVRIKEEKEIITNTRIPEIEKSNPYEALKKYCDFKEKPEMLTKGIELLNKALKKDEI